MTIALRLTLLCTVLMLVSACGFHLRGAAAMPTHLQPIYIGGNAAFGPLGQRLRIRLLNDSIAVTRNPSEAAYQLIVLDQYAQQRTASLDQRGRVAESALFSGATFELRDSAGRVVWGPIQVEERRTIINNPDNISSTTEEARLTRDEMIDTVAARILRRAAAFRPESSPAPRS